MPLLAMAFPKRGNGLEEVVVWYCYVDMAADKNLTEEGLDLRRTEGLDLAPS
jgi:hypothetical protein